MSSADGPAPCRPPAPGMNAVGGHVREGQAGGRCRVPPSPQLVCKPDAWFPCTAPADHEYAPFVIYNTPGLEFQICCSPVFYKPVSALTRVAPGDRGGLSHLASSGALTRLLCDHCIFYFTQGKWGALRAAFFNLKLLSMFPARTSCPSRSPECLLSWSAPPCIFFFS